MLFRRSHLILLSDLESNTLEIVTLQALSRAMVLRVQVGDTLAELDEAESSVELMQSAIRGCLVRTRFAEKKRYFKENMQKVVKLQSHVRARPQCASYNSLPSGAYPTGGPGNKFGHLLNDSDFDLNEEVESEQLRKTVVQQVRQNELAEQYISQLDIKIALLVKNKISLDEVLRHHKGFGSIGTLVRGNAAVTDPVGRDSLDLKALNKDSHGKLELYQAMFFLLQTQPGYLARWFRLLRERATPEKECERAKHLTMGLFGYAQKHREEYHLLRLLARAVREEVGACAQLADYQRGHFFWARVFGAYTKTPRDRRYLRDLLAPVLREHLLDNPELDLESDPLNIYHAILNDEQLRTGRQPARRPDVTREEAIRDPETRAAFVRHMQDLRDVADHVFAQLEETLARLPYGAVLRAAVVPVAHDPLPARGSGPAAAARGALGLARVPGPGPGRAGGARRAGPRAGAGAAQEHGRGDAGAVAVLCRSAVRAERPVHAAAESVRDGIDGTIEGDMEPE